jgi:hypothetical protein
MAENRIVWRVAPPAHLAQAVRKMALAEGRTDTNMISRLIGEAVSARRAIEAKLPEVQRLADLIRGRGEPA